MRRDMSLNPGQNFFQESEMYGWTEWGMGKDIELTISGIGILVVSAFRIKYSSIQTSTV